MAKLKDLIANEQKRRAARQKNSGASDAVSFTHKGGQGKTSSASHHMDMSLEGQMGRLGLEPMGGNRRLTAMLNATGEAFVICDGQTLRLSLNELGVLSSEETQDANPMPQASLVRRV